MTLTRSVALLVTALALCEVLSAQAPRTFQFAVSASDASGAPVTDLKPEDATRIDTLLPGVERLRELAEECFSWQDQLLRG